MTFSVSEENTIFDVLFHVGLRKCDYQHVIFSKGSSSRPQPCENFKWYVVIGVLYKARKHEVMSVQSKAHGITKERGRIKVESIFI